VLASHLALAESCSVCPDLGSICGSVILDEDEEHTMADGTAREDSREKRPTSPARYYKLEGPPLQPLHLLARRTCTSEQDVEYYMTALERHGETSSGREDWKT